MPVSPGRLTAFDILLKIETQAAYSSELLHSERVTALSPQDGGLCMEIVMGVLRWRSRLDAEIARFSFTPFRKLDPEVLTALRMGAYQLEFLGRVPAHAAINESVELVKHSRKASAAPLANAVLRKMPKAGNAERADRHAASFATDISGSATHPADALANAFAHPKWIVEQWISYYGFGPAEAICRFDQQVPATALRLRDPAAEAELRDAGVELAPGLLLRSARRVVAGDLTRTPAYAEQRVAIQDEASQLVAALVGRGTRILDCCAAPGGKTAALAERNPQAEIIAADLHEHRARLMRRLVRAPNVRIIAADAVSLPVSGVFDCVLADVPCSGTGTLARNPEIKWRLRPEDLSQLHTRQVAILASALTHLAPGGRLIYSSCSLEPEENEAVVAEVLSSVGSRIKVVAALDVLDLLRQRGEIACTDVKALTSGPYLRTLPGIHPCDGFFAAILERT